MDGSLDSVVSQPTALAALPTSQAEATNRVRQGEEISKAELAEVKQAIDTQDKIIGGLEKDNDRLRKENKAMIVKLRDTERALSRAEAKLTLNQTAPNQGNPEFSAEQHEALSAKVKELHLQLEKMRVQEDELRLQLDTVKKEKKEAERRFAEVDPAQIEHAELEARTTKAQLSRATFDHTSEMEDMLRKVAWYVEHQETTAAQEELIKEQQRTIHDLRMKLVESESLRKGPVAVTEKDKRIRQLERLVAELEETIREKNPNSIPELIRACRPSHADSASFKRQQAKIDTLEAQLRETEGNFQRIIDRLRVESDAVKLKYQTQLAKVEEEMKGKLVHFQSKKVKELEKQLSETRRYYTEKIKELEGTIVALRKVSPNKNLPLKKDKKEGQVAAEGEASPAPNSSPAAAGGNGVEKGRSPSPLTYDDAHPVQLMQQFHLQGMQQFEMLRISKERDELNWKLKEMELKLKECTSDVSKLTTENDALKGELRNCRGQLEGLAHHSSQLEAIRASMAEEHRRGTDRLRQQYLAELSATQAKYEKELSSLRDAQKAFELLSPGPFVEPLHREVRDDNTQLKSYLRLVADRLRNIEQVYGNREEEFHRQLQLVQQQAEHERMQLDLLLQQKNTEIHQFQLQLDQLLGDLAHLHAAQRKGITLPMPIDSKAQ
jgi:hypothetical protein